MMQKKLLKLILNHKFFIGNKHRLVKTMFPDEFELIYNTIVETHETYQRDITISELRQLFRVKYPMLTRVQMQSFQEALTDIESEPDDVGLDVAQDVLKAMWKIETGRRIMEAGNAIIEGKASDTHEVMRIIESTREDFLPADTLKPVTTDVNEIIEALDARSGWRFNLPILAQHVPCIGGGELGTIFARPETGKTGFWVSLVFGRDGFLSQGARVHAIINEEPAIRTMARGLSCASSVPIPEFKENRQQLQTSFAPIRDRCVLVDSVDMTIDWLDLYCRENKPDILIVDQLDKVGVSGTYGRPDERLKDIYIGAREIAKRHNCAVIAVSQASAEAEGKTVLHYSMMENSRTGKAAENDLIIGIGRLPVDDNNPVDNKIRYLTVSKNKLTGWQGTVNCLLEQKVHQYVC